jgi:probable HAF family extracellular repeat protein
VDPAVRVAGIVLSLGAAACGDDDSIGPEPPGDRCAEVASSSPFVELGTLGGAVAFALDVNDRGEVAGMSLDGTARERAVRWSAAGAISDLGTITGYTGGHATAINERGEVAGFSSGSAKGLRAVLWNAAGELRELGTLGGAYSVALTINEDGAVAGLSQIASGGAAHAFYWTRSDGMRDLGRLAGTVASEAMGLNGEGEVVGTSLTEHGRPRAFFWSAESGMRELMPPAGVNAPAAAAAINDAGAAVGSFAGPDGARAVLWPDAADGGMGGAGGARDLGTLGGSWSEASDINACTQVIGTSENEAGETRAFVWTEHDGMVELDAPADARATTGVSISDDGVAVGQVETADGGVRPIRWRLGR